MLRNRIVRLILAAIIVGVMLIAGNTQIAHAWDWDTVSASKVICRTCE